MQTVTILPPLNLQRPNSLVVGYAKQDDAKSRYFQTQLLAGDTPYEPPEGVSGQIRFVKPDGHGGWYTRLEDNSTIAVTWEGSTVTMAMAEQVLTCPGDVLVDLMFMGEDASVISAFHWTLRVEKNVIDDAILQNSEDYFNILTEEIAGIIGATTHPPQIDEETKNWLLWDEDTGAYVDSGESSVGIQGEPGDVSHVVIVSDTAPTSDEQNVIWIDSTSTTPIQLLTREEINPVAKVNNMTQEVGVDANGRLWTNPNGTGEPGGLTTFTGKTVATSAWVDESANSGTPTYDAYPYHADITCSGVTADYFADIVFAPEDAQSGMFAPVCETISGGVRIWASDVPDDTVTIPTIATWR